MKRILLTALFLLAINVGGISAFAETQTIWATGSFDVSDIFSLEFYTEPNKVLYSTAVPFTDMLPTTTHALADYRVPYDGKSDVGLVCRTNFGASWYLKIHASPPDSPLITIGNIKYYLGQPWNRTLSKLADGEITGGAAWHNIPPSSSVIYTAGPTDLINTPWGTLCTFSFAIDPSRLTPDQIYNCAIQFTFTTSP